MKINVYQPRVSPAVAPVVQETGANIWQGVQSFAQGASEAAQATMMKIKQIEIETETEEGIVAQDKATREFLDGLKKAPIYPVEEVDENGNGTGKLKWSRDSNGWSPNVNLRNEDGQPKDREELHAEVLDQYFRDIDQQIQDAPMNPRARENVQDFWNRQKVQVADQVRDQMIADDLATLRQRQMDLIKTSQEAGDVAGADGLTREGVLNGFLSEAQKIAIDNQTRIMAAKNLATELASATFDDAFAARPVTSLAEGIAAVDSETLTQLLSERNLSGYYNAETREEVRNEIRARYREKVNEANALTFESSVQFRKRIHDVTALTDIPALRTEIIDDYALSNPFDKWHQQQRLLNLLKGKESSLQGGGSGNRVMTDPVLWEFIYRREAGYETIERGVYDYEAKVLAKAREEMSPMEFADFQVNFDKDITFTLKRVKARSASNDPRGDVFENIDNVRDALLKQAKDPEEQRLIHARANHMKEVLPALHNELWDQGVSPEEIYKWLDSSIVTLFNSPLEITSRRQFNNIISDSYYGVYGIGFVADEFRGKALTDGAVIMARELKTQGVTAYKDTARFLPPYTREEDGEVVTGEIFIMQGEVDGEMHWFMPDPRSGKFRIYAPDPNNPNQSIDDMTIYVPTVTPRENPNFSPERNTDAQVIAQLDHNVGIFPVSEVFGSIKTIAPEKSDDEIYAEIQNTYTEKLRRNIRGWMEEYNQTTNSRRARNAARRNLLPDNIQYGIRFYVGPDAVKMLWEEVNNEYSVEDWLKENPKIDKPQAAKGNNRRMVE